METNGTQTDLHDRGVGELVKELSAQVSTLVRQEVDLAKVELADKGKKAGRGAGMYGAAGVTALLMLGSLTAFLILVLALALPGVGCRAHRRRPLGWSDRCPGDPGTPMREMGKPIPEKTVETLKEDVQWLKNRS